MNALTVNDLQLEVRRSERRRPMEITVDRGGALVLSAPSDVSTASLRDFVQRKRMWVYKQLARRDALGHSMHRKAFVDGEDSPTWAGAIVCARSRSPTLRSTWWVGGS